MPYLEKPTDYSNNIVIYIIILLSLYVLSVHFPTPPRHKSFWILEKKNVFFGCFFLVFCL
jgi:hypothetical protein